MRFVLKYLILLVITVGMGLSSLPSDDGSTFVADMYASSSIPRNISDNRRRLEVTEPNTRLMDILLAPVAYDFNFGWSVSMTNQWGMVGDPAPTCTSSGTCTMVGQCFLYSLKSNTDWTLLGTLTPPTADGSSNMYFGNGVNIFDEWAMSGAPGYTSSGQAGFSGANAGAAYIYKYDSGAIAWSLYQRLVPSQDYMNQQYGYNSRVTIDGNGRGFAITGAPNYYYISGTSYIKIGAAFIYTLTNGAWTQNALMLSPTRRYVAFYS